MTEILPPPSVRFATAADVQAVTYLMRAFFEESLDPMPFGPVLPVEWAKVEARIIQGCHGQGGCIGVIDGPSGPIATTGVFASQPWWSEQFTLVQYWIFVDAEHRAGTNHGEQLMQFAKWFRQDRSNLAGYQVPLEMSVTSAVRLDAKLRLWQRHAELVGGIFHVG